MSVQPGFTTAAAMQTAVTPKDLITAAAIQATAETDAIALVNFHSVVFHLL